LRTSFKTIVRSKVLIIGPYPPPFGGVATFVKNILIQDALHDEYDLHLFRTGKRNNTDSFLWQTLSELYYLLKFVSLYKVHFKLIHVHTASYWSFLRNIPYVLIPKYLWNCNVITHIHGAKFHLYYRNSHKLQKWIIKYSLNASDCIIVVSSSWISIIDDICGNDNSRIYAVSNGFDSKIFYPILKEDAREKLNLPKYKKIILNVGHLEEYKGQSYLIDAIKEVASKVNDTLCLIVGSGSLRDILQEKIEKSNLQNHIRIMGNTSPEELALLMNACDVFVLPSLNESFGIVQIEAMACGKPIVATINGGSENIIRSDDYGYLVAPMDSSDLAEKIVSALDRDWDAGKITDYANRFEWRNIAREVISIYKVIERENGPKR